MKILENKYENAEHSPIEETHIWTKIPEKYLIDDVVYFDSFEVVKIYAFDDQSPHAICIFMTKKGTDISLNEMLDAVDEEQEEKVNKIKIPSRALIASDYSRWQNLIPHVGHKEKYRVRNTNVELWEALYQKKNQLAGMKAAFNSPKHSVTVLSLAKKFNSAVLLDFLEEFVREFDHSPNPMLACV